VQAAPHDPLIARTRAKLNSTKNEDNFQPGNWLPAFSQLLVRVVDANLTEETSPGGIVLVEANDKLPYIKCEVVAIGENAGWNTEHTAKVQDFQIGDICLVFEKHVVFHFLDGGSHSDYYAKGRPYFALVPDTKIIAIERKA
jgi:co-chaperonin GroES (HSP10)